MTAANSSVLRGGQLVTVHRSSWYGDILVLAEGDSVGGPTPPCFSSGLRIAEPPLTGESERYKDPAPWFEAPLGTARNMVYKGPVGPGRRPGDRHGAGMTRRWAHRRDAGGTETSNPAAREITLVSKLLGVTVVAIAKWQ